MTCSCVSRCSCFGLGLDAADTALLLFMLLLLFCVFTLLLFGFVFGWNVWVFPLLVPPLELEARECGLAAAAAAADAADGG